MAPNKKTCKLQVHQSNFSVEDLVINPKDFPHVADGNVVEIHHPEDEHCRLLLQVKSLCFKEDFQSKDTISVEHTIASSFHLRKYSEVYVNVVDPNEVALDSVELTFKDQYVARSDMWRLKKFIDHTCVYINKTVTFAGIRTQVYEMWAQGERVGSGVITPETKIVFRSLTSMVYLFLQMSSEMWDFDINGDLYFEKAVYGFLADLFEKWKKYGCNHDVTVVLFSRTFYKANSIDDFPENISECIQKDYKGRFYEDFYRIAVQNERYDDWSSILVELKRIFSQYNETVLNYHKSPGRKIPEVYNSTASQGNFLEVLNMSLSVFERHFTDRSLDRTGQLSVVITPGVGVFEVDRELANVTKQRIIDSGIGSDLVCLGEQPLHAVPLFKFQSKNECYRVVDDYNMPHWINLSFYSCTNKRLSYSKFVPRIKLPTNLLDNSKPFQSETFNDVCSLKRPSHHDENLQSLFDYNAYDSEIFKYGANSTNSFKIVNDSQALAVPQKPPGNSGTPSKVPGSSNMIWRKMSEDKTASGSILPEPIKPKKEDSIKSASPQSIASSLPTSRSAVINIPMPATYQNHISISYGAVFIEDCLSPPVYQMSAQSSFTSINKDDLYGESLKSPASPPNNKLYVGSSGVLSEGSYMQCQSRSRNNSGNTRQSRALINPFDPSHLTIKLTSIRRRWTHVFPIGPKGGFMQEHHRKTERGKPSIVENDIMSDAPMSPKQEVVQAAKKAVEARKLKVASSGTPLLTALDRNKEKNKLSHAYSDASTIASSSDGGFPLKTRSQTLRAPLLQSDPDPKNLLLVWGATGEQEWSPSLTTGVDWKSLTVPACLPITIDYFPDNESLKNDFLLSNYSLQPEVIALDFAPPRLPNNEDNHNNSVMPADELFKELVLQRLQQSFQIILLTKEQLKNLQDLERDLYPHIVLEIANNNAGKDAANKESYFLSIGRIFHKISLNGSIITVTQYRPRHPYPQICIHYRYRFQAPDNPDYGVSFVYFTTQLLENYIWNYVDHYIAEKGNGEYPMKDTLNYWRVNLAILPNSAAVTTRRIIEDGVEHCDIYPPIAEDEQKQLMEGFIKFVEVMNKIRRPVNSRKQKPNHCSSRRISSMGVGHIGLNASCQASSVPGLPQNQLQSSFRERVSSNRVHDRPRTGSGSKARERMRSESGNLSSAVASTTPDIVPNSDFRSFSSNDSQGEVKLSDPDLSPSWKLSPKSFSLTEIIDCIKKQSDNTLPFFIKHPDLPPWSFLSCEATAWAMANVDGVNEIADAIRLFEDMRAQNLLLHASEDPDHPVIYGFYIYFFVSSDYKLKSNDQDDFEPSVKEFQKKWFEIEFLQYTEGRKSETPPCLRRKPYFESSGNTVIYDTYENAFEEVLVKDLYKMPPKLTTIGLEPSANKDRLEWGAASYDYIYNPAHGYEVIIKWMVATGSIISEFLIMWQRKALSHGLHLIPIPFNPFAVPYCGWTADPLRGPVFVHLKLDCIVKNRGKTHLFQEYTERERKKRLILFQEAIAHKFGFIPMQCKLIRKSGRLQHIHVSGGMFVMITKTTKKLSAGLIPPFDQQNLHYHVQQIDPNNPIHANHAHKEYVTRHITSRPSNPTNPTNQVGFLWSWNHMLTKRWRSQTTGETPFQDKMLADFSRFCANSERRLEKFWDDCQLAAQNHG